MRADGSRARIRDIEITLLLLLDEPTSALDQATEVTVFERLRNGLPNTCLIASIHRLSALVYFNRVIVMAEGRVVDSGTVAEILERQPAFREVVYSAAHAVAPATAAAPHTVHRQMNSRVAITPRARAPARGYNRSQNRASGPRARTPAASPEIAL